MELNKIWEQYLKDCGTDFVYFIDASALPAEVAGEYTCAVLFGKALSKEYIAALRDGKEPKRKEVFNIERKMDKLALTLSDKLQAEGFKSAGKFKTGILPNKTVALRAGIGFIGKNNLLITEKYGCALMLGKVLTTAPFETISKPINKPKCGDCSICKEVCPTDALHGTTWSRTTTREDILDRKKCVLCVKCMVHCPYTAQYIKE